MSGIVFGFALADMNPTLRAVVASIILPALNLNKASLEVRLSE